MTADAALCPRCRLPVDELVVDRRTPYSRPYCPRCNLVLDSAGRREPTRPAPTGPPIDSADRREREDA
jgi:uncharacterized paraquat-inducible protein A